MNRKHRARDALIRELVFRDGLHPAQAADALGCTVAAIDGVTYRTPPGIRAALTAQSG